MSMKVQVNSIEKNFGGNAALNKVDLEIPAGQIRAVIGPNGAGKSTLFAAIAGELKLDSGSILFDGHDVTKMSSQRRVKQGIGRAFQVARLFPTLSVRDNIVASILSRNSKSLVFWSHRAVGDARLEANALLEELRMERLGEITAGNLSQGDRKRLEIAMVLALQPKVLLLDEPTAGMSPEETEATVQLIRQLWKEHNLTVLITEHDMDVVFGVAQEITVMFRGGVLCTGDPETIRAREDVAEVYLGGVS